MITFTTFGITSRLASVLTCSSFLFYQIPLLF